MPTITTKDGTPELPSAARNCWEKPWGNKQSWLRQT